MTSRLCPGSLLPPSSGSYVVLRTIAQGGYGTVYKAKHLPTKDIVAIKHMTYEKMRLEYKRVLREIILLKRMSHPNLMCLRDAFTVCRGDDAFDIYLVMPCFPHVLCSDNSNDYETESGAEEDELRFVVHLFNMFLGLDYLHKCGVVHRDLNPRNILVDGTRLMIADFGLSREKSIRNADQTFYVVTRPYRAPELVIGSATYDSAIDIWACGCTIAEMATGRKLFSLPTSLDGGVWSGYKAADQLTCILKVIGSVESADIELQKQASVRSFLRTAGANFPSVLLQTLRRRIAERMRLSVEDCEAVVALVQQCLHFNPNKRPSADTILRTFPLFKKHNLLFGLNIAQLEPSPLTFPDLSNMPFESVMRCIHEECTGLEYRPFPLMASTPLARSIAQQLSAWHGRDHLESVRDTIESNLKLLDRALGQASEDQIPLLELTAHELMGIDTTLNHFLEGSSPDDTAAEIVTQSAAEVCEGDFGWSCEAMDVDIDDD